ncbi:spermidine/putrescine ABC transporter ATP-binding protein [Streptomyces sp. AS58]|uniref:Spermidine/putrescine import ATP-binding protein PotA n=2 Tax=Streptomyces TaxID=1883 RepID=A0A2Z4JEX4_9ACTN|nr:ABC transporter ATP-binding protein [Streptomyces cadmiisoli]AWW43669.1 polyamine ABC transporter ATP-binding protein [Streptomyces cadmiisoli]KOV57659.1 spermidine/putrescine ABC transporter ATP-binding protein [Streptomyces sp. AS58]
MRGVVKSLGGKTVVDGIDLTVGTGEFFSILGPSGCGKTTSLRMLAGFLTPDSGHILLQGADVTSVPPYRRDVNTVFQTYALFGHLSVAENVAFGLRRRRVPKPEIVRRVGEALELVDLADRPHAKPQELSGGQRQRVALARALVNLPKLLLLDEPLGALDLQLRRQMQQELKRIQREVGITFVYVTHDQEEALTMSDQIAVMNRGRIEQVGHPREVYDRPSSAFVARFIGTSNLLDATARDGSLVLGSGTVVADRPSEVAREAAVRVSIRPEKLALADPGSVDGPRLRARVQNVSYLGVITDYRLETAEGVQLTVVEANPGGQAGGKRRAAGDEVDVTWHPDDVVTLTS